jgi:hypothetical protein
VDSTWVSFLAAPLSSREPDDDVVRVHFAEPGGHRVALLATAGPLADAYLVTALSSHLPAAFMNLTVLQPVPGGTTLLLVADTAITGVDDSAGNGWSPAARRPEVEQAWTC